MKKFKHVIITRFNYPEDKKDLFDDRMKLFKKYTLPSVKAQTNKDFTWVFFSNKELDIDFSDKKFVTLKSYKEWKKELSKEYEYIIETRLDNDYVISPNFIESIQLSFMKNEYVIEFKGYRYDQRINQMYEDTFYNRGKTSPFVSLVSKLADEKYIFDYSHGDICNHFKTLYKEQKMWAQVIHNSNKLMNKDGPEIIAKRGKRCSKPFWFDE